MLKPQQNLTPAIKVAAIQFFTAFSENILRGALVALVAFGVFNVAHIKNAQLVDLTNVLFVVPLLLFSSYAGKLVDMYNKAIILQCVMLYQLLVVIIVAMAFYSGYNSLLLSLLFAMGLSLAFFHPVKFSILPELVAPVQVGLATSFIEFSNFIGVLSGQIISTIAMSNHKLGLVISLLIICGITNVVLSYSLKIVRTKVEPSVIKFYLNPFKDTWLMLSQVKKIPRAWINLHAVGWFWTFVALGNVEVALFVANYLGGDGHLYSFILAIDSLGIAIGSILCAKLTQGKIKYQYVINSMIIMSITTALILFSHSQPLAVKISLLQFIRSFAGSIIIVLLLMKSCASGVYSIICYSELQLNASHLNRSQVMAAATFIGAGYLLISSSCAAFLQHFISSWGIIFAMLTINLGVAFNYWRSVRR